MTFMGAVFDSAGFGVIVRSCNMEAYQYTVRSFLRMWSGGPEPTIKC